MIRLLITFGLIGLVFFLGTIVVGYLRTYTQGASLLLYGVSKTDVTQTVLEYYQNEIIGNDDTIDPNQISLVPAHINTDTKIDLIAKIDSEATCGSGGCITTIFIQGESGQFEAIPFKYAIKDIEVTNSITDNMHDLRINNTDEQMMKWDGERYTFDAY